MRWNLGGVGALLLLLLLAGCNGEGDGGGPEDAGPEIEAGPSDAGPRPGFPLDVEERYQELRDCRSSHEHELRYIRVLASESAADSYTQLSPDAPYPVGANLVKLEYDDAECTTVLGYTEVIKLPAGENPAGGDWLWQKLDPKRNVVESGAPWRCINCHSFHCAPPNGFDLTCAEEL